MKSLEQFKVIVEEEKSDYSKFDALVRAGLANKAQMQRIHKILDKMGEEHPTFNNADRQIVQNLFNKMVDLISNNKQINQVARRAVHEGVVDTADFKLGKDGKKVRAHRVVLGNDKEEVENVKESIELTTEGTINFYKDPPFMLLLKRKAIRMYPDGTKVALYYNKQFDKHFTIPYGDQIDAPIQAEEVQIEEAVMDTLHNIVKNKQVKPVKFANGTTMKVDHYTASAITQVHNALNDDNKKKFADMVHKSKEHFAKASDFAFKHSK
jgi:hypothetical protein